MGFYDVLQNDEKAIYNLRELYRKHGYSHYKVSKFEEYDFYAGNKNFLVSENILTFTDTDGKLMALKPDVTLSIIKNVVPEDSSIHKLYYNEYVYRTSAENNGFREIMQTGVECIGEADGFSECEVIMLAMKSLETVSEDYLLDISHMGLIEGIMELAEIEGRDVSSFLKLISAKNIPGVRVFCEKKNIPAEIADKICTLAEMYLPINDALSKIEDMVISDKMKKAYDELCRIANAMELYGIADKLYLDISVINDMNYYDGVIFNGFIKDIPESVLSGGRYDRLLSKLGKTVGAIGFAVYLDKLERFGGDEAKYDVDIMLTYGEGVEVKDIVCAVDALNKEGKTVRASAMADANVRYRQRMHMEKKATGIEVEVIEKHD